VLLFHTLQEMGINIYLERRMLCLRLLLQLRSSGTQTYDSTDIIFLLNIGRSRRSKITCFDAVVVLCKSHGIKIEEVLAVDLLIV